MDASLSFSYQEPKRKARQTRIGIYPQYLQQRPRSTRTAPNARQYYLQFQKSVKKLTLAEHRARTRLATKVALTVAIINSRAPGTADAAAVSRDAPEVTDAVPDRAPVGSLVPARGPAAVDGLLIRRRNKPSGFIPRQLKTGDVNSQSGGQPARPCGWHPWHRWCTPG